MSAPKLRSFSDAEVAFLDALEDLRVRYLVVGASAAVLQGAPLVTEDVDLWFGENAPWEKVDQAARRAGGFYTGGFGLHVPPTLGGPGFERLDLVVHASGLSSFDLEYQRAKTYEVEGRSLRVLPLDRVIHSKRAAGRPKDQAVLPALEAALRARESREPDSDG